MREIGDKVGEGSRLGGLGVVQSRMRRWKEAEASHRAALDIAVALHDRSGMAHQFGSLATVKAACGDLEGGIADARKAIALFALLETYESGEAPDIRELDAIIHRLVQFPGSRGPG